MQVPKSASGSASDLSAQPLRTVMNCACFRTLNCACFRTLNCACFSIRSSLVLERENDKSRGRRHPWLIVTGA